MATIKAPNRDYDGQIGEVVFKDGVAETDNRAVLAYCRGAGYEVEGVTENPPAQAYFSGDSSRTHQSLGTPLRDAVVDPQPVDFLPPVNAGQADPHGPAVVSPEIHASPGPTPLVPGLVLDDPAGQQARESAAAEQVLIEQRPAGEVVQALAEDRPEQPAGNASQAEWASWVIATHPGLDAAEVQAMKRDDLRDTYGNS